MKAFKIIVRVGWSAAVVSVLGYFGVNGTQSAEPAPQPTPGEISSADTSTAIPTPGYLDPAMCADCSPRRTVPNMIGSQFGGSAASALATRTQSFTGILRGANGDPQVFHNNSFFDMEHHLFFDPFLRPSGVTGPFTLFKNGVPLSFPSGSQWVFVDANSGFPPTVVAENPDETAAVRSAFPGATTVQFVSAQATLLLLTPFGQDYTLATDYLLAFQTPLAVNLPNPANGGVVGRIKISENNSALPQDRLLLDFNYFHDVPLYTGVNVERFTPGFEKTFFDGQASIELRAPTAVTLDNTIVQGGGTDLSNGEFGDMRITPKVLLLRSEKTAVCLGMTVTVPTGADARLVRADGAELVRIHNESVVLGPFLGGLFTSNDRLFFQGFLQYEVDAGGSPVSVNPNLTGLERVGELQGTTFQYVDLGAGWWAYRDPSYSSVLQGVALVSELHWSRSLAAGDFVQSDGFLVGDLTRNTQLLDLTLGMHFDIRNRTTLTAGYSLPIGNGADHQFEGEFRLMLNRFFGPSGRPENAF